MHLGAKLVVEGGFDPLLVSPRPPLRVERRGSGQSSASTLVVDLSARQEAERILLGGLKTKEVDVVVDIPGVGPCLAISVKGTLSAFRNLTNRMEEAVGDCTNLHIVYPALVYGFMHVLRANLADRSAASNDVGLMASGEPSGISRYHDILMRLTGRSSVRNDASRYEAIAMGLVDTKGARKGTLLSGYPPTESPLRFEKFFPTLLAAYDSRFVYSAPALQARTQRLEWDSRSPALQELAACKFEPRVG